jgi:hypothetical protein
MAICLDYQAVYYRRQPLYFSLHLQVAAALILLAALAARVWIRIETTDLGYRLARERQRAVALDMERRELELHLSVLHRPDTLVKQAKTRLGLTVLNPKQAWKVAE